MSKPRVADELLAKRIAREGALAHVYDALAGTDGDHAERLALMLDLRDARAELARIRAVKP